MSALTRVVWAEVLKLKRTLVFWLAMLWPLSVVVLESLLAYRRGAAALQQAENSWLGFGQQMLHFSTLLVLPLFIALQTALLGTLEHGNDQWKHLYALPLPHWTHYLAKQLAGMVFLLLSVCLLVLFTILAGFSLGVLKPEFTFEDAVPWITLARYVISVVLASQLIVSIHTWFGLRSKSLVSAMTLGIVATLFAMVSLGDGLFQYYPWALPAGVSEFLLTGEITSAPITLGVLGGIFIALLGCWDVTRRDVL